jgi:hypothetical protein
VAVIPIVLNTEVSPGHHSLCTCYLLLTFNQVRSTLCNIVSSQFLSLPRPLNVLCSRLLVLGAEEAVRVARKPGAELTDLLTQTVDRLDVHVGLSDHLWHVDYDIRSVNCC